MALTIDWPNATIQVPQADLTLVSGTIYRMNTETYFRTDLMAQMDDEQGIIWPTPFVHNTEVTVAGVTYARVIDIAAIPVTGTTADGPTGYPGRWKIEFTPNSQWTVILEGSNNNIFDVENGILVQNQVQVIPTNSAGLQTVITGSGVTEQDKLDIADRVWDEATSGHATAGTFGESVGRKLLQFTKWIGLR